METPNNNGILKFNDIFETTQAIFFNLLTLDMRTNLIFLIFLISNMIYGQVGPINEIISCHPCGSDLIINGDIDKDGITDLLIYSEIDQKMAWAKNDGRGNFITKTRIPDYEGIIDFIGLEDLDGDGDLDLFFSSQAENTIGWFENESGGQFNNPPIIISNEAGYGKNKPLGDIDQDGDIDIVASIFRENKILIFENDGLGNFTIKQVIENEKDGTSKVYLEDLDGDMDVDLYAVYGSGLVWFNNDGTGHFDTLTIIDEYTWVIGQADFADLDGDGDIDIITSEDTRNEFGWYVNEGNGQFKDRQIIGEIKGRGGAVKSIDFDMDGDMDIVNSQELIDGDIFWLENDGEGNFSVPSFLVKGIEWLNSFLIIDLDGDGDMDIATGGTFDERPRWFEQMEDGSYKEHPILFTEVWGLKDILAVDLDNDGADDILAVSGKDESLSWFANDGAGNFDEKKLISTKVGMNGAAYTADIDMDGDQDVFYADRDTVGWFENNGQGQFTQRYIYDYSVASISFASGDFDMDGDIDMISAGYGHFANVFFHVNDGQENFEKYDRPNFTERDGIVQAADLDGDGDLDLLMSAVFSGSVSWRENNGGFPFSDWKEHFFPSNKSGWATVIALDVDKDEDLDVAISSKIGVEWFENDGQGAFSLKQTFSNEESTSRRITSTDLDNDGWIDMIVMEPQNNQVLWFRNDGLGSFIEKRIIIPNLQTVSDITLSDMDGDGDDDFVTISRFDKIAWFENLYGESTINSITYFDENRNGTYDEGEQPLPNVKVQLEPLALSTFADTTGKSEFFLYDGDFNLTAFPDSCYVLTTDSISYNISLGRQEAAIQYFGFALNDSIHRVQPRIMTDPVRCGFTVNLWINITNEGCINSNGQYGVILDTLVDFIDSFPSPDYIIQGDTLIWSYDELLPNTSQKVSIPINIAGVEHIGDTIHLRGISFIEQADGTLQSSESYNFLAEIRCAYDPNDKLVTPNRMGQYEENYTLFEEDLEYTIRFQNTGTDTAFNVVIKDYLDEDLDWTTFKPITSSHEMKTFVRENGLVEFSFENILLPDSIINEPLSHGFITYTISPKKDIPENTLVENTANIYFDFNPPIVTNTIQNRYVSALPRNISTSISNYQVTSTPQVKVYPNPFFNQLNFEIENYNGEQKLMIRLFNLTGKLLKQDDIKNNNFQMSLSNLNNGLYFYQIINSDGYIIKSDRIVKNNNF